jgi:hypothetical protein
MPLFKSKKKVRRDEIIKNAKKVLIEFRDNYTTEYGILIPKISSDYHREAKEIINTTLRKYKLENDYYDYGSFDIKIKIKVSGTSLKKQYTEKGRIQNLFSGAEIMGKIQVIADKELPIFERSFSGAVDNPDFTYYAQSYRESKNAPFEEAFKNSNFQKKFERVLFKFYRKRLSNS